MGVSSVDECRLGAAVFLVAELNSAEGAEPEVQIAHRFMGVVRWFPHFFGGNGLATHRTTRDLEGIPPLLLLCVVGNMEGEGFRCD